MKRFLLCSFCVLIMVFGIGIANGSIYGFFPDYYEYIGYAIAFSFFGLFWLALRNVNTNE